MKLATFFATILAVLIDAKPLTIPEPASSDLWVGLNLNKCLINTDAAPKSNLVAQQETVRTVIDAYNAWDINAILAYRTPDCKHQVLPSSMNRTAESNDDYRAYFNKIMPLFTNFTAVVLEEIHDAGAHKSIIHASSTAETKIGPYANEYMLVLKFTKDGKKVTEFNEFVDSAYSEPFFEALENETSSK